MKTISLTSAQVQGLVQMAKDALPNECCAFLLAEHNDSGKVAMILPMRNIDESPVSFSIDPTRSEEHTSELQSRQYLVCRLLLEKTTTSRCCRLGTQKGK